MDIHNWPGDSSFAHLKVPPTRNCVCRNFLCTEISFARLMVPHTKNCVCVQEPVTWGPACCDAMTWAGETAYSLVGIRSGPVASSNTTSNFCFPASLSTRA
jgi:hypothetical protein